MSFIQDGLGQEVDNDQSVHRAQDEYTPMAIPCVPESVTVATLNEENRKYWEQGK